MKLRFFTFALSIVLAFSFSLKTSAQNKSGDIVYLKNGTVIHGTILELIPDQSVKIQTVDGKDSIYKMDEVEKIIKGTSAYPENRRRYTNIPDVSYLIGVGNIWESYQGQNIGQYKNIGYGLSIRDVNGWRLRQNLILGVGIGYEYYGGDEEHTPATEYVPIFFAVRAFSKGQNDIQGGFLLDVGYDIGFTQKTTIADVAGFSSISITDKYKGGFFINPAISLHIKEPPNHGYYISAGYQFQSIAYDQSGIVQFSFMGFSYSQVVSQTSMLSIGFINFRAGYEF